MNLTTCTAKVLARICGHCDHESTDSHSCAWCVLCHGQVGADDLMRSTEARAQQGSVIVSPPVLPPTVNSFISAFPAGGLPMHETSTNGKLSGGLLQEDSYNTRSDYDIEVQVDTSMIRDTR